MSICLGALTARAQTFYSDRSAFTSDPRVTTTQGIDFDALPAGTDLTGQTISNVTFGAPSASPLEVINAATGVRFPMNASSGAKVLSPGGSNPSVEDDDLSLTFDTPVKAAGLDVVYDAPDGASFTGVTFYDALNNVIAEVNPIAAPSGEPGYAFVGLVCDSAIIKRIVFDEYDDTADDDNIAYDSIVFMPGTPVVPLTGPLTNPANGHSYYLLPQSNWTDAEAAALALGGHLATINDGAENQWVFDNFAHFGGVERGLWIGLNDAANEGIYVWSSGEPTVFTNWDPTQPDNGGGGGDEDYVHLFQTGVGSGFTAAKWNDLPNVTGIAVVPTLNGVVEVVPADTTTELPVLTVPANNAVVGSLITVSYALPETALAGSVEVNFHDGVVARILSIATAGESAGPHSFSFLASNPAGSGSGNIGIGGGPIGGGGGPIIPVGGFVSGGPPIPAGTYSVVVSYQDAAGNARQYAFSSNVLVDLQAPTLTLPDDITVHTSNLTGTSVDFDVSAMDDHDPAPIVTPTPASGSTFPVGTTTVQVVATDWVGNVATDTFDVTVVLDSSDSGPVVQSSYLLRSDAAPTDPDHALFNMLRPPMINGSGKLTFKGTVFPRDPTDFDPNPITAANDLCIWADKGSTSLALMARENGDATDVIGGKYANFSDPLLSDAGEVAFKATLKTGRLFPGFTGANSEVIYSDAPGNLTKVVRKGDPIVTPLGGASGTWKTFNSMAPVNGGLFGLATLTGVTPGTELIVWSWQASDTAPQVRLQKKTVLDFGPAGTRTVNTIDVLTPKTGVVGQGRSFNDGGPTAWVRSTFVGGGAVLLKFTTTTSLFDTMTVGPKILPKIVTPASPAAPDAAPGVTGAVFATINSPATNAQGHIAFTGTYKTRTTPLPAITGQNDGVLWAGPSDALTVVAREGDAAPGASGAIFTSFGDPVLDDNDRVAFLGKMKIGTGGVANTNDQGLWAKTGEGLKLIAREGTTASFLPGSAVIASFTSVAIDQRGGLFKAKLKVGVGGVTSGRDDILVVWRGADGAATVALRERQYVEVFPGHQRRLITFDVINPAPSPVSGVGRSFNSSGQVMTYCTFIDGTTGFIGIDL